MKATAKTPAPLFLALFPRYLDWARDDLKLMTTRRGLLHTHAGQVASLVAGDAALRVQVTGQHFRTFDTLTGRDAELEGFASLDEMRAALLACYPDLQSGEILTCVRFRRVP